MNRKNLTVCALAAISLCAISATSALANEDSSLSKKLSKKGQITGAAAGSIYTESAGSSSDYTFKLMNNNGDNEYYKVKLNTNNMSSDDSIKWREGGNSVKAFEYNDAIKYGSKTIEVILPHNGEAISSGNAQKTYYTMDYNNEKQRLYNRILYKEGSDDIYNYPEEITGVYFYDYHSNDSDNHALAINGNANPDLKYIKADIIKHTTIAHGTGVQLGRHATTADINAFIHDAETCVIGGTYFEGQNSVKGNYIENATNLGVVLFAWNDVVKIEGNYINNRLKDSLFNPQGYNPSGAAIYVLNDGDNGYFHTGSIQGNFIGNYAERGNGGAIGIEVGNVESIEGDFINNYVQNGSGGAIYQGIDAAFAMGPSTIHSIKGNFVANHAHNGHGGAISNAIDEKPTYSPPYPNARQPKIDIISGNFIGNYAQNNTEEAKGGAIYSKTGFNFVADNEVSTIIGNYTDSNGVIDDNAIYLDSDTEELKFTAINEAEINLYDNVRGKQGYTVVFEGDESSSINLANKIYDNASLTLDGLNLNMRLDNVLDNQNLFANSGTVNMVNNNAGVSKLNSLTLNGDVNFIADVDLATESMDRFTANSYGNHLGKLNVIGMNMLSDTPKDVVKIYFAQEGLKDNVVSKVSQTPVSKYQTTAYTPIYRYTVAYIQDKDMYDETKNAGYFVFAKGSKIIEDKPTPGRGPTIVPTPTPSDAFNPAVLAAPIIAQAGAGAAMSQTINYAFEHGETFMNLNSIERFARTNQNTYALSADYNWNLGLNDLSHSNKSVWVKPYSVFEKIDLVHGPKVDTISYGTLVGFDSSIYKLKRGWSNVGTVYLGYNGSQIRYDGVDASTNGGLLGLTETFYKGNFWTAVTATAGGGAAEAHTMYGKDDMAMLMAGIGTKTGYNFEFAGGKFIIQPRVFFSYSMINTFDYTNAAGVRIDTDPLHMIQLSPAIKFIGNTKNGWQPYASVGMVWNLMNHTNATANGIKLPNMYTRPYVEYGVGVQKLWNDRYSAYGQAMVRNGGRTGIALTLGFRMGLGKEGAPIRQEKVQETDKNNRTRKVLKKTKQLNLISVNKHANLNLP